MIVSMIKGREGTRGLRAGLSFCFEEQRWKRYEYACIYEPVNANNQLDMNWYSVRGSTYLELPPRGTKTRARISQTLRQ